MEFPTGINRLQNNLIVLADQERDAVGVGIVLTDKNHLVWSCLVLDDIQVLLVDDDFNKILEGDPSGLDQLAVLLVVPDEFHSRKYITSRIHCQF